MSISEIKEYIKLCYDGETTIPQKKAIFDSKRKSLMEQLKQIQDCINYIDQMQVFYDNILCGKSKYCNIFDNKFGNEEIK